MQTEPAVPGYYFPLPRLLAQVRGRDAARSEKNWIEANITGGAVMLITFLAIGRFFWSSHSVTTQLALTIPTLLLAWIFWLVAMYLNAQVIKALRALKLLRSTANAQVQSVCVISITTALAWSLLDGDWFFHAIGTAWIVAVAANIVAALLLRFTPSGHAK